MERVHLDRDGIVSVMGEGALQRMPKGVRRCTAPMVAFIQTSWPNCSASSPATKC